MPHASQPDATRRGAGLLEGEGRDLLRSSESVASPAGRIAGPDHAQPQGLARSIRLFRLFRREQAEPETFYAVMAQDAADQLSRYLDLAGQTIVDVGGGPGIFTAEFRARGAASYVFEPDRTEMFSRGGVPDGAVLANGFWLPIADGAADVCFSSNVIEHVPDPHGLIDEMIRVTRPGGLIYVAFTNWFSPWGGHDLSPWHLLGADYAARRYVRRHGRPAKHVIGKNLFRLHIGSLLKYVRSRNDVQIVETLPRYYPRWCKFVVRIPLVREVATWNALLIIRRKA